MKRGALLFVAALLCLAPAVVMAQSPPNAVTLKAGAYFPQANDVDDFDSGFNMEVSYTRYFLPHFALELGVGYFNSEDGAELTSYPFTVNLKGVYPFLGAELYALGGIGAYYVKLENGGFDENDTVLGYQLGIGANVDITPVVFIGAEGKYFWAKPDFGGPAGEVKIDGILATVNLGYRF
jgi:opacity protein-like surface antigen